MANNLMDASREWMVRPADQRYESLDAMYRACKAYADSTTERMVPFSRLQADVHPQYGLVVYGKNSKGDTGKPATFSHFAFNQLCTRIGAPAEYLRSLPENIAAMNIQTGIQRLAAENPAPQNLLIHENGKLTIRSVLSQEYTRIWNHDLVELCQSLPRGWQVPPARPAFSGQPGTRPATEADCLRNRNSGLSIKPGDMIAPAGLYASDRDCFIFMVNEECMLEASGKEHMARGFFLRNSEVGDARLEITMFYYSYVCGNHIVWDAQNVQHVSIVHRGRRAESYGVRIRNAVYHLAQRSAREDMARITAAKDMIIDNDTQKVAEVVFRKGILGKRQAEDSMKLAVQYADIHGDPRSAWGFSAGVTRLSQNTPYAGERDTLDSAASKVLSLAWK